MLTRTDIKSYTITTSYNKGLDLYRRGMVMKFSVEEEPGMHTLSAAVKGSGRNQYQVYMEYDTEQDCLRRIGCECPAFHKYSGICKHCVAVLLEYLEWQNRQGTIFEYAKRQEESRAQLQQMKGKVQSRVPATTPALRQLLARRQQQSAQLVMQGDLYGGVRLEPLLYCDNDGNVLAEFKIGTVSMYVLKDVFPFVNALRLGEFVVYGQKLQFVHRREMFAKESLPWVDFVSGWVMDHAADYVQSGYALPKMRRIPLSPGELEAFLDAAGGQEFLGDIDGSGSRLWQMTQEPLTRTLTVCGTEYGVEVRLAALYGLAGNRYYHYFDDGKVYRIPAGEMEPVRDFLSCMAQVPGNMVFIRREDVPMFCRELLPALEQKFVCHKENFDERDYGLIPVTFEFYLDAPDRDLVTCKPVAVYGEQKYPVFSNQEAVEKRDLLKEAEVAKVVSALCDAYDDRYYMMGVTGDDRIYEFLTRGIGRLSGLGDVYISDALKRIQVSSVPKVSVGISMAGEVMELRLTAEDMPREQLLEILSKYSRKRRFYRLKSGDFIDMEGEDIRVLAKLKQGLGLTDAQMREKVVPLPKYRALYLDSELREHAGLMVQRDRQFRALVRNMKTVEDNDFEIPPELETVLREYQKRGFLWIKTLKHNGFGGILADDMGLGKTLQVIAFLQSEIGEAKAGENCRCLIVSPASLVFNWNSEIERFAPGLKVRMIVGTAAKRRELIEGAGETEILLTSYDLLKRDVALYEPLTFAYQIIDEAQYIKNHSTQVAKAAKAVRAGFKLALTGTPVENRLSELWSIFDYLMPGFLYSYQRFREELEAPIVQNQDEEAMKRLQKMIRPFVLRRLKGDVLTDLPAKIEKSYFSRMEGEQQELYDAHVKRLQILLNKQSDEEFQTSKIKILSELTRLRQLCCDPALVFEDYKGDSAKLETCMELIRNATGGGHKILLFSQFTSMLERIEARLTDEGISFFVLTGSTGKEKRAQLVERFNQDDTSVFCISLKAGGTGLNLTGADIVIHFDPWWNLAVQNQATDRAHRIGQEQVVTVYKLISQGTIEENIMKLQEKKRELAEEILGGEGMKSGSFSKEELLELLV